MSLGGAVRSPRGTRLTLRLPRPRASAAAWCAIGIVAAFVLLTLWWLTQDRATPSGDAAEELWVAFRFRDYLLRGDPLAVLDYPAYYPPYATLLGGIASLVGGVNRNAVVLGENLVGVPVLALSCYHVGRRVAGAQAGALAVAFALGSPLLIEQFHVFIIDALMAAVVALSVWLILASERFDRVSVAALAGLAVGIGTGTKEQFPLYLVGLVGVVLARGGWRNGRGLAAFLGVALAVAAPWYVRNADILGAVWSAARTGDGLLFPVPPLARPPLLSSANAAWYGWATLNGLLFAPLTAFAAVGVATAIGQLRHWRRARSTVIPELLGGLLGSWLLLTLLTHKDMRYALPLIVYLAVLGTAWIVRLAHRPRRLAIAGLAAAVLATTLGATFGVGGPVPARPPGNLGAALGVGVPPRDRVVVYANHDYLVAGPRRDGDLLRLLRGLHRIGIRKVYWDPNTAGPEYADFNGSGLMVLARIARLSTPDQIRQKVVQLRHALLIYESTRRPWAPCVRFSDGKGVWALIGAVDRPGLAFPFCPERGWLGPPMIVPVIGHYEFSTSPE